MTPGPPPSTLGLSAGLEELGAAAVGSGGAGPLAPGGAVGNASSSAGTGGGATVVADSQAGATPANASKNGATRLGLVVVGRRTMQGLERPPALSRGDIVRVVAPAGAFDRALFFRGLGWLAQHFRVRFDPGILARTGFLAGTDERRIGELDAALSCPLSRAIVAARGGHGCTRIVDRVDFAPLERHPKWLVGFSDLTAIHLELQSRGLRSLHAHNVTGLGPSDALERGRWILPLVSSEHAQSFSLHQLYPGPAEGPLWGGNLTLLSASLCSDRLLPEPGAVLLLEEVGEAPYRLDRLLVELERRGVFDRVSGVVSGYFTPPSAGHEATARVLAEFARRVRVPWLHGLPCGHERPNYAIELGAYASFEGCILHLR